MPIAIFLKYVNSSVPYMASKKRKSALSKRALTNIDKEADAFMQSIIGEIERIARQRKENPSWE